MRYRALFKAHGGKFYLQDKINGILGYSEIFAESHVYGANVLLGRDRAPIELVNDLNPDVTNAYTDLKYNFKSFAEGLDVPYSEESFLFALSGAKSHHAVIRNRMSRSALGENFSVSKRLRGGVPEGQNAWDNFRLDLERLHRRLADVEVFNLDAIDFIDMIEFSYGSKALIYCDPPYLPEKRTSRKTYRFEMTREQHILLLEKILRSPCRIAISGYDSTLYNDMLKGWKQYMFDMPNHSGQGKTKQRRIECLWVNR